MKKITVDIAVYTFVVLFLYTGLSKFVDFNVFVVTLGASPLVKDYKYLVAVGIPTVELVIVLLLLIPKTKRIGFYASFFLMVIFTAYVAIILGGSEQLPCSCGGVFYKITWKPHLFLNIFLTLLAGTALMFLEKDRRLRLSTL